MFKGSDCHLAEEEVLQEAGTEVEKENWNVLCVVLSVSVWCMCCGSVRPIVRSSRASFMVKPEELLGDRYGDFEVLSSVEKTSYVFGSELWEQNFKCLLSLVKEFYCKRVGGKTLWR